jgi:predicted PurR-regulated permease PerM
MACGLIWWRALLSVLMTALSGLMLAVLLLPVTIRLEARMKPGPAAALAMILLIGVVLLFLGLVFPALADQAELLFAQLPIMLEQLNSWITSANELLVSLGAPTLPDVAQSLKDILKDFDISIILRGIMHTAGGVFGRIAQALLIPMIAFYFLRDREMFCHGMTLLIPIRYRRRAVWTAIETRRALILYLRGHALISLFVGGLSALGLLMIGVNAWLALGVWIALTDFVPYFGPIIGMVPIVLFGPAIGWNKMLWSLVLILVIQQIETNWLSPRVISEHMGIHPVTVLIVLALGNLMFGIWGLILSLPIMIAIKTMIRAISSIE